MRVRRCVGFLFSCVLILFAGCASVTAPASPVTLHTAALASADLQVTVGSRPLGNIPPDFIGFSYEKSILSTPLFGPDNRRLVGLFRLLGHGVLRIGGNSVNKTQWAPDGGGLTPGETAPSDIRRFSAFVRETGWTVIYGVNGTTSSPARSAAEGAFAAQALGDRLDSFEIGNEPDIYHENGLEPALFSFAQFRTQWAQYRRALLDQVRGARFSGPASAYDTTRYTLPFVRDEGDQIDLLTAHYYRANGRSVPPPTIDLLLAPDPHLPQLLTALREAALKARIPGGYRIAETNSFYNGGAPGISDLFGTALWAIDYSFTLARYGAGGLNFHGGGSGPGYTPIANTRAGEVIGPRPEYYGIFIVSRIVGGTLLPTDPSQPEPGVHVYAVDMPRGSLELVVTNDRRIGTAELSFQLPHRYRAATERALTAASLDATAGISFGGAPIPPAGKWNAAVPQELAVNGTRLQVQVPAASAAVFELQ